MMRMRDLAAAAALALALSGLGADAAQAGEWVSLFDGKTLSGWFQKGGEGVSKWEVVDGVIYSSGKASMLYSPKGHYKNFRFRAEIKIGDGANSGLYFRCPKGSGSYSEGYEAQINSTHTDPIRTGSVYGFAHVYKQLVPPDTWFTYEVEVVDKNWRGKVVPHIKVSVNGELLYELIEYTKAWDHGHFAFQQHPPDGHVYIRKIEVQELDEHGK